jgi:hypothetical protein
MQQSTIASYHNNMSISLPYVAWMSWHTHLYQGIQTKLHLIRKCTMADEDNILASVDGSIAMDSDCLRIC